MAKRILALFTGLALLGGCTAHGNSQTVKAESKKELSTAYTLKSGGDIEPLQKNLTISHADLSFSFDFDSEILFGLTALTLHSDTQQQGLSVDLDTRFAIEKLWVNDTLLPPSKYSNSDGQVFIAQDQLFTFPATLKIQYSGHPRTPIRAPWDGGVMWEKTPSGAPWLATAVQGEGCDLFWPCIDQPFGEPATVDLRITVPKGLVAASNGKLVEVIKKEDADTFHWQTVSLHNTYGIALNIAPYEVMTTEFTSIYGNHFPITYYHLPGDTKQIKALFDELPQMITFFERMIGPYPFGEEKVGIVQTPHLGMEHQTINAYGNDYKKDEYGYDWLMQHEFSHEWFGNQLTNDDWDHMWLHEGLGSYMQPLYAQYLHGDLAYMSSLNNQRKGIINQHPIVSNKRLKEEDVYENGPGLDIYYKGSWVMHTLRYLIGDDAFFRSVKEIVYGTPAPKPGNFSPVFKNTQDFIDIVNRNTGQDLDWFFDVYLYHAPLPKLLVTRTDTSVTFAWQTDSGLPFPMPLEVSVNGKVHTLDLSSPQQLPITPIDTVIADPASKVLRYEQRYVDFKEYEALKKKKLAEKK
ncbi:M1 family metallopeptidase [Alteromonas pelagimontana]|uniref:Aminopeptidase N n=1 Tax=Alteromonas pelagimontana TaxID=1858656 RepID=A0A6M4MB58_9ALTE|nr:M1 family metallopeptidase [Alteromonas pelagimontana]QJR80444.1 M1 family metallopeptidase [Alteromonas pelagimontana]